MLDEDDSKIIRYTNQEGIKKRIEDIDVELAVEADDVKRATLEKEQKELQDSLAGFDQKISI